MGLSMEKLFRSLLAVFVLYFFASQAAMAQSYPYASGEKFVSGIANVATGFVELPKNIVISSGENGVPYGMTVGLVTGIFHTVGRTVIGALDMVTFLIPTGPSVSPPYIWNNFYNETTYGSSYYSIRR
jgi:putative exosortase-associated protein (TIGR04073 family)